MLLLLSPMSICQKTEALLKGVEAARFLSILCMYGTFFQKEPFCKPILQENQVSMYTVLFLSFYHEQILMQLPFNFKGHLIFL